MMDALVLRKPYFLFPFWNFILNVLEANVRVEDQKRAESCIRDGVKAASSERSDTQRDQAQGDESVFIV